MCKCNFPKPTRTTVTVEGESRPGYHCLACGHKWPTNEEVKN